MGTATTTTNTHRTTDALARDATDRGIMVWRLIAEAVRFRELLFALTYHDIRVKYKQAFLGVFWVFFMPIMAIASGVVFRLAIWFFRKQAGSEEPFGMSQVVPVMVKSVPWLLFASIVGGCSGSLINSMGLITKIYFPRQVVPFSSMLSSMFDFSISVTGTCLLLVLAALFVPGGAEAFTVTAHYLWLPVLLLILVTLATGLGLIFSCANLFVRDVRYLVQMCLNYGVFFSLVFLHYEDFQGWGWIFFFNPVAPILESIRSIVCDGRIAREVLPWLGYSIAVALVVMMFASRFFKRSESLFAEFV